MSSHEELQRTIARVQQMEQYLDKVLDAINTCPYAIKEDVTIRKMLQELTHYYESGQWLQDYESDERGELPADFKRGVLSQDTLYDLLSETSSLK